MKWLWVNTVDGLWLAWVALCWALVGPLVMLVERLEELRGEKENAMSRPKDKVLEEAYDIVLRSHILSRPRADAALRRGIHTEHVNPPIPIRDCDWVAWFDDYDGAPDAAHQVTGRGRDEVGAIVDLLMELAGHGLCGGESDE